jgi:hypothetical protein
VSTLGLLLLLFSACSARQADVQTNTISAANPTAMHTASDTGNTRVGLAARDGECANTFAGRPVRACRYFFKAALAGGGVHAVVPAGADTDVTRAYGDIPPGVGPIATVEAPDKISLQPQVKYQTQACAYIDYTDDAKGFEGPFCAGSDTTGDGRADLNTFGPEWITATDPSGFNVFRINGLMLHWADTGTERHVDVGNCMRPSLLASNPGLQAGLAELGQFNVAGRMLVRNVACNAATQEIRAYNRNLGANGVYGRAEFDAWASDGHYVFNAPSVAPNPQFFVNDYYVGLFGDNYDELVVKHEIGHNLGLSHDDRSPVSLMRPVNFGTPTEVDQRQRDTLSFLYGHTDAYDGNSGDSAPPAQPAANVPAFDPVVKKLRQKGRGAKLTLRAGRHETITYVDRGDTISVQFTVYAPDEEGRQAATAAAETDPLGG